MIHVIIIITLCLNIVLIILRKYFSFLKYFSAGRCSLHHPLRPLDPGADRGQQGPGQGQGHQQGGVQLPRHVRSQVRSWILETWQRHHSPDHS